MDANVAVIVFAKAAQPGRVKTRLCPPLTAAQAAEVHAAMLEATLRRAFALPLTPRVVAITPDDALDEATRAWPRLDRVLPQGEGDLGVRMRRAIDAINDPPRPILLLGVDSPDLPTATLEEALRVVQAGAVALCPSRDGGYCTLGLPARPLEDYARLFAGIDWGSSRVAAQTRAAARGAGLTLVELPAWQDVDDRADLAALLRRLADADEPALVELHARLRSAKLDQLLRENGMSEAPQNASILIADDNPQLLELLEAYLEALPVRVISAMDGEQTLSAVETEQPDLILLDVMMPRHSGYEVCRMLKDDPRYRDIPIVMVTALNEVGDLERARECGADDYLTKPVNKLELLDRVTTLLEMQRVRRQHGPGEAPRSGFEPETP